MPQGSGLVNGPNLGQVKSSELLLSFQPHTVIQYIVKRDNVPPGATYKRQSCNIVHACNIKREHSTT